MLTRPGWAVVAGSVAAIAAGRLLGTVELYLLGAIALVLVAVALAWVQRPVALPTLERRIQPRRPVVGAPARAELVARNRGRRRTGAVTLVDEVDDTVGARLLLGPIEPGGERRVGYRLPTARRGPIGVGPLTCEVIDPLGLARRRRGASPRTSVTVLPAMEALRSDQTGVVGDEPLAAVATRPRPQRGLADPATLRPYVVGDDLRRVHWPTSARVDDLVVRRDEERQQGQVHVLLDTEPWRRPDAFEAAVGAAATLVHATAESGERLRLSTTSGDDSGVVDARGSEASLLEALAHVRQRSTAGAGPDADGIGAAVGARRSTLAHTWVILTESGRRPPIPVDAAIDPGDVVVVRFGGAPGFAPGPRSSSTTIDVPLGTSFAAAWTAEAPRIVPTRSGPAR